MRAMLRKAEYLLCVRKPRFYGEALTLDEVYESVSEKHKQKEARVASKTKNKNTIVLVVAKLHPSAKVTTKLTPKYRRIGRFIRSLDTAQ